MHTAVHVPTVSWEWTRLYSKTLEGDREKGIQDVFWNELWTNTMKAVFTCCYSTKYNELAVHNDLKELTLNSFFQCRRKSAAPNEGTVVIH